MQQVLESEMAERAEILSNRYHRAAVRLSNSFTPGTRSVTQVQQLFLTANWLKNEVRLVESWHALGSAIREAQELGMEISVIDKVHWLTSFTYRFAQRYSPKRNH